MTECYTYARATRGVSMRSFLGVIAVTAVAIALTFAPAMARDRGLQFTPDGKRRLANKDVASERWAITLNEEDGTVVGNVFREDGGSAAFIACRPLDGGPVLECFGADPCEGDGGSDRGIQQAPFGDRVLVSKDVGSDRWAISRNEDGSVTGNVFRGDGGEPAFLACDPAAAPGSFDCYGADACVAEADAPCADLFTFLETVTLPEDFFRVPEPCGTSFDFLANVTLPDGFFSVETSADLVTEVEAGGQLGQLRVGAAPIPTGPQAIANVTGDTNTRPGGTSTFEVTFAGASAAATGDAQLGGLALVVALGDGACSAGKLLDDWYRIPLVAASGPLSVSVTFSEALGGEFALCVTTMDDDVTGQYFTKPQVTRSRTLIDFESIPGVGEPESLLEIGDQFVEDFGVRFRLETSDGEGPRLPVLARVGAPREAFAGAGGADRVREAERSLVGQFFLTDDGVLDTSDLTPDILIVEYLQPTQGASGRILDIDFDESFEIELRGAGGGMLDKIRIVAGDPGTGNGAATPWSFSRPQADVVSLRFQGFRAASGGFGLGFDNFDTASASPAGVGR